MLSIKKLGRPKIMQFGNQVTFYQNDTILDLSKLKAFADDTIDVIQKMEFDMGREESIVEKGGNASNQLVTYHRMMTFNYPEEEGF